MEQYNRDYKHLHKETDILYLLHSGQLRLNTGISRA